MSKYTFVSATRLFIGVCLNTLLFSFILSYHVNAATFPCSKCAPGFAYTKAAYKSSTANCSSPVTDITYSCDCACGSTSATQQAFGNCRTQCANAPTATPPSPTPTTTATSSFPCASKCSANYDYTKASSYTSTTANCANPVAGSVTYSCDCSCGTSSALHQTYGQCSQQCAAGGTPSPTPITECVTENCGSTGCMVRCCTTTKVGTSSTTNCVSKIGPTPSPTPLISAMPSATSNPTASPGPSPTGNLSGTPVPSVTSATSCACVADSCSSSCVFDAFSDIAYSKPLKCTLPSTVHFSSPDAPLKNQSCTAAKRTKGDADGNGTINMLDYMYYISASFGGKVPPAVNPDFSGDGVVGAADRSIIIKSLPTQ